MLERQPNGQSANEGNVGCLGINISYGGKLSSASSMVKGIISHNVIGEKES